MEEVFVNISGTNGRYMISNMGSVYSNVSGRIMKQQRSKHGYNMVHLRCGESSRLLSVHRLVAKHFVHNEDPLHKNQVDHIDNNKVNNIYTNLQWCTCKFNIKKSWESGRVYTQRDMPKGEDHHMSKLTWSVVKKIRERYASGDKLKDIASDYGIPATYAWSIANNNYWVDKSYKPNNMRSCGATGLKGVYKNGTGYIAKKYINGKLVKLGTFKDKNEAYQTYLNFK